MASQPVKPVLATVYWRRLPPAVERVPVMSGPVTSGVDRFIARRRLDLPASWASSVAQAEAPVGFAGLFDIINQTSQVDNLA